MSCCPTSHPATPTTSTSSASSTSTSKPNWPNSPADGGPCGLPSCVSSGCEAIRRVPASPSPHRSWSRDFLRLGRLPLGAIEDAVDGGAADGEHLHQLGDGVLAACVHADQLGLLAGGELGLLAL